MERMTVDNGGLTLGVLVDGPADSAHPPILCVHGWPELSHSWRNQIDHFARRGFRIAAMDVRGYGESDKPHPVEAYTLTHLTGDVAAVIDALGGRAILFGHDWGAPIVWHTALRHPQKVIAVAGLSVPYVPMGEVSFLDAVRHIYQGQFFYQLYFQDEGVAEAEFENDPDALRKIYWGISGEGIASGMLKAKPAGAKFLDGMSAPAVLPEWMREDDLRTYEEAFRKGGWRGPLNRYRAQPLDHAERAPVVGRHIAQPACFIAGTLDPVRMFVPGTDLFAAAGAACDDFRGTTLVEGAGHWVQQERPAEVNAALDRFVDGVVGA
jgi:pimeloyl-ACP methyl ester carboxylesterase